MLHRATIVLNFIATFSDNHNLLQNSLTWHFKDKIPWRIQSAKLQIIMNLKNVNLSVQRVLYCIAVVVNCIS